MFILNDNTEVSIEGDILSQSITAFKTDHSNQTCQIDLVANLPICLPLINNPYCGGQNDKIYSGTQEIFDIRRFEVILPHNVNFIYQPLKVSQLEILSNCLVRFSGIFWMYGDPDNAWHYQFEVSANVTICFLE